MPFSYLRVLTGHERTQKSNRHLARYLAFIAGAVNAGGFLAVRQYTSHMSGIVSAMADNLALGSLSLLFAGFIAVFSFLAGATCTSLMVRWARQRSLHSEYALPLILESLLLFAFGFTGHVFEDKEVLGTVALLCFTMGLQNAIVSKISGAVIRTTHLTGMVTDVGVKLGRMLYGQLSGTPPLANVDVRKLSLLGSLIGLFFVGGVVGALGFHHIGFKFTIPVAVTLLILAALPALDDLRRLI
ncbi:YoaK family protein [Granulicella tundricola]|uniref:Transmembrane protein n=1 Tax=Granulicella tundricola (strain ATCC BAA-1859 / DSM 23138 / MP5ACTX9) TaxID=1198114 RepID=E8X7C2_GRATM|nr:YoaK family protein [Granulicella tundricola]ADW71356.1 protein of unknown function DUF1275 [Granulicella tundricola MP5ACTX9]